CIDKKCGCYTPKNSTDTDMTPKADGKSYSDCPEICVGSQSRACWDKDCIKENEGTPGYREKCMDATLASNFQCDCDGEKAPGEKCEKYDQCKDSNVLMTEVGNALTQSV